MVDDQSVVVSLMEVHVGSGVYMLPHEHDLARYRLPQPTGLADI